MEFWISPVGPMETLHFSALRTKVIKFIPLNKKIDGKEEKMDEKRPVINLLIFVSYLV